jgi:GT2 family glycosyltransferase
VEVDGDMGAPATPDRPIVEICIVSYNSATVLARTIASIEAHVPEAVVAIREHGSDQDSFETLEQLAATSSLPVRIELDESNPGFGSGCNALARGSRARWLLFLNPDAVVLAWPWTAHDPPPERRIVGPFMVGDGESERQSGRSYRIIDEIARSWFRRTGPPPDGRGFVSGAALLIDRGSFERLGGFDERYFMFYEDIDLCLRANDLGMATEIAPAWRVRHEGAHATSRQFGDSLQWSYESACRFHRDRGESVLLYRAYVAVDSTARMIWHTLRRRPAASRAYRRLLRTAFGSPA